MKYKIFTMGLLLLSMQIIFAKNHSQHSKYKNSTQLKNLNLRSDTCILSGKKFKFIEYASERKLQAVIKNNQITIAGKQNYRITHYVFSSKHDERIPALRIFDGRIDFRILDILSKSRYGIQYIFEDIIVVDASGKKLLNDVKSIIIERLEDMNNTNQNIDLRDFSSEFSFTTTRSSGPGGQNVNKLNTKVILAFDVMNSNILEETDKVLITSKLHNRINSEGILKISSQTERTQLANKEQCVLKFYELIADALTIKKERKQSKPSKAQIQKRLDQKKIQSKKKQNRNTSFTLDEE